MQEQKFTKKDWTLFRNKIADWQEAYMDRLNKEYIELYQARCFLTIGQEDGCSTSRKFAEESYGKI